MEEGELSDNPELELEQTVSEEQTYRETMRGIRSYMGWSHVPDVDSSNPSDDNLCRAQSSSTQQSVCPDAH